MPFWQRFRMEMWRHMAENDKVVVTKSKLDALASALRTIFGFTGKKTIEQLTEEAGHYDPRPDISDATATAAQILKPYTAYVNGGKVTGEIESLAAQTISPAKRAQSIPAGVYLAGAQTIAAMKLQTRTITPSNKQQIVTCGAGYDALESVTVKGVQYPVLVKRTMTAEEVSSDKKTLVLSEAETQLVQASPPSFALVYTKSTITGNNVVCSFCSEDFSAYMSMTATGAKAEKYAYGGVAYNSSGRAVFALPNTITATFASVPYEILILGGGSW